jgi:hypothetical protein
MSLRSWSLKLENGASLPIIIRNKSEVKSKSNVQGHYYDVAGIETWLAFAEKLSLSSSSVLHAHFTAISREAVPPEYLCLAVSHTCLYWWRLGRAGFGYNMYVVRSTGSQY